MIIFKKIFIFILVVTVLTLSVFVGGKVAIRMLYPTTYSELVEKYCEEYGVEKSASESRSCGSGFSRMV